MKFKVIDSNEFIFYEYLTLLFVNFYHLREFNNSSLYQNRFLNQIFERKKGFKVKNFLLFLF